LAKKGKQCRKHYTVNKISCNKTTALETGVNSCATAELAVPTAHATTVVLLLNDTNI